MSTHVYVCPMCHTSHVKLRDSAVFVPVMCAECCVRNSLLRPFTLVDPIIYNGVLYVIDLSDAALGVGPEVIVRYFDGRAPLRTARLRVVLHVGHPVGDTATIIHRG